MQAVAREADQDTQVTERPDYIHNASSHNNANGAALVTAHRGDMMPLPRDASNQISGGAAVQSGARRSIRARQFACGGERFTHPVRIQFTDKRPKIAIPGEPTYLRFEVEMTSPPVASQTKKPKTDQAPRPKSCKSKLNYAAGLAAVSSVSTSSSSSCSPAGCRRS